MLLAGLAIGGWLLWEFFGTTVQAHRSYRKNVALFERGSKLTDAVAIIRIPRFGKSFAVPAYQGIGEDILAKGFGHYPGTAWPGQKGNFAIAGHRITHGQPLRDMPELRPGDLVDVETHVAYYVYRLDTNPNNLVVPFTAGWVLARHPVNPSGGPEPGKRYHRLITLTTCSELFHTDNRMIAFGHLVKVIKRHPGRLHHLPTAP
jgi:sortase A